MKKSLAAALLACFCFATEAIGADESNKSQDDVKRMQGDWKIEAIEADGQNVTNDLVNDVLRDVLVRVEKDKISLVQGGGKEIVSTTMALNAEAIPKAADFQPREDAFGVFNGESMWGIYELKQDQLKICVSINTAMKQRPVEFKTKSGSSEYLLSLKRP